eukprot:m.191400 g.191400  ORF g.191400 m.191400 type:complete len:690 (+) comp18247_c0_seq4:3711-5780(+)
MAARTKHQGRWPLHRLVWDNDHAKLSAELATAHVRQGMAVGPSVMCCAVACAVLCRCYSTVSCSATLFFFQYCCSVSQHDVDEQDPHGRTPLRLAVALGHTACAKALLECGADAVAKDCDGWTATHDATSTGDAELLRAVLEKRNFIQRAETEEKIPQLLQLLEESPDFYCEMHWDFSSWVPLVSRLCPSDTYRIWKRGASVRVDTTLLGYSNMQWQRGQRTFLFKPVAAAEGAAAATATQFEMVQVDHDSHAAFAETVGIDPEAQGPPSPHEIQQRFVSAIVTTTMDKDKVGFERVKTGIWGWQSDKTEDVEGTPAKVFQASGIEIVTKTRVEHLPAGHPARKASKTPMAQMMSGLGQGGDQEGASGSGFGQLLQSVENSDNGTDGDGADNRDHGADVMRVTADEYFAERAEGTPPMAVGRRRETRTQKQTFKARLCIAEEFPLSLREQILPILDLLAPTSAHLANLRDFVSLQLPAGFPVKVEIPVYRVLTARVTFRECRLGNVEDDAVFQVPEGYRMLRSGGASAGRAMDDEDAMLMLALQRSMQAQDTFDLDDRAYDAQLQQALMASLASAGLDAAPEQAAEDWECQACTFLNPKGSSAAACSVCATPRAGSTPVRAAPALASTAPSTRTMPSREEEILQQVLALSLQEAGGQDTPPADDSSSNAANVSEEEQLRLAIERSLSET